MWSKYCDLNHSVCNINSDGYVYKHGRLIGYPSWFIIEEYDKRHIECRVIEVGLDANAKEECTRRTLVPDIILSPYIDRWETKPPTITIDGEFVSTVYTALKDLMESGVGTKDAIDHSLGRCIIKSSEPPCKQVDGNKKIFSLPSTKRFLFAHSERRYTPNVFKPLARGDRIQKKDDIHRTSSSLWPVGIAYKRKTIYTERLQAFGPWGSHTKERRYTPNVFKPLARGDRIQKKDDIHRTSSSLWPVGIAYKRKTIYTERLQAFGPWGSHTKERRYTPNVFKPLARGDRIQKKDDIHRTSSSLWPVGIAYKRKTIYTERLQAFGPWGSHTKERRYTPNVFKPLARGDRIQKNIVPGDILALPYSVTFPPNGCPNKIEKLERQTVLKPNI
ncbi:uncharacterized protein LOC121047255 [Ixodes scapularis]|uniref:uncharacterized protein LOC121047255 n=1 Tax=Ixodes scapularis TaxID=6945 RepID=UPI001C38383F|nr:uncharacterized protein LOC121047255 [Ixodes scapularis]